MREADWTSLVHAVERGNCTLMLGPSAVTGEIEGERLPVNEALAAFVRLKLGPAFAHLDPKRPATVAQAAVAAEDPFTLQGWVEEFYDEFDGDFEVLRILAALPFALVVNSSPGLSAHRIFSEIKPGTKSDFYDRTAPVRPMLPDATADEPVVYHLFGSLEQPSSMVLSESDRLDFLVSVVSDEPPLPPKLKSALRDPDRSMLFVGFELWHWQFRVLLHVLSRDEPRRYKSFAFETDDQAPDDDTREFYRSGHKIHFVGGDLLTFAEELRDRVDVRPVEPAAGQLDVRTTVPPDAPTVFLCHASEDKLFAKRVSEGLEANGIGTWLDRDQLRGGDQWDSRIRQTIGESVDYVVVLQSASLRAKDVGYVNREINLALDRQLEYRPPRRFLIPAVIDDAANCLDELRHLQTTDLATEHGMDELVRVIKRDLDLQVRQSA